MDTYGMTPEEMARRQALIERVSQYDPELAAMISRGPYRINQGSPQQQSPQGPQYPQPNSAPAGGSSSLMASPTINSAQPMGSTWNPANQPAGGAPRSQPQFNARPPVYGQPSALPVGNPAYDSPAETQSHNWNSQPAQPTINVNVTGTQPSAFPGYPTMQSQPPNAAGYGDPNAIIPPYQAPLGASSPNYVPPESTLFGGFGNQMAGAWQDFTQPNRGYQPPPPLTGADFGPAQQMTDLGVRRPAPMVQMQAPFTDTGWGNLSR